MSAQGMAFHCRRMRAGRTDVGKHRPTLRLMTIAVASVFFFSALCLCGRVRLLAAIRLPRSHSRVCLFGFSSRRCPCVRGSEPSPIFGRCARWSRFEPTDAEANLVTSEGSWLFQILAERRSQLVQAVGVGARDVLPLQRLRRCLKDSVLNMTLLVFAA